MICCGYILGFPNDTPESILRDVRIIQSELPIDVIEFTCLTPLPGSEDHRKMYEAGVPMDADLNRYDVDHVTTPHPLMSREEWEAVYRQVYTNYYSNEHIEKVLRRCVVTGTSPGKTMANLVWFRGSAQIEKVHPMEGGFLRLKFRKDRRPILPTESPWIFYPKYLAETLWKQFQWASLFARCYFILRKVIRDPKRSEYKDLAVAPVTEDDLETQELFQSAEAQAYLVKIQKMEKLRHGNAA
jgi:hypothetical protein